MAIFAVGGEIGTSTLTTRVYNSGGSVLWTNNLGVPVQGLRVSSTDYVVTVGVDQIRKIGSDGTVLWTQTHTVSGLLSVNIDDNDYIYVAGQSLYSTPYLNITKYTSSGTFVVGGQNVTTSQVSDIAIGSDGIYVSKLATSDNVTKYDFDLNVLWTRTYSNANIYGLTVDSNNNVTVCGARGTSPLGSVHRYDADGNLLWSYEHGTSTVYKVAVDSTGNVYFGGSLVSTPSRSMGKLSVINGSLLAYAEGYGGTIRSIALSPDYAYILVGGSRVTAGTHALYDSSFSQLWVKSHGTTGKNIYGVSITKGVTAPPSDAFYTHAHKMLTNAIDWNSSTLRMALVSSGYTFSAAHTALTDLGANVVANSEIITATANNTTLELGHVNFLTPNATGAHAVLYAVGDYEGVTDPLLIYLSSVATTIHGANLRLVTSSLVSI